MSVKSLELKTKFLKFHTLYSHQICKNDRLDQTQLISVYNIGAALWNSIFCSLPDQVLIKSKSHLYSSLKVSDLKKLAERCWTLLKSWHVLPPTTYSLNYSTLKEADYTPSSTNQSFICTLGINKLILKIRNQKEKAGQY